MSSIPIKNSITTQLFRLVFYFYLIVTIIVTFIQIYVDFQNTQKRIVKDMNIIGNTFMPGISKALWDLDTSQLKLNLQGIVDLPFVTSATLINEESKEILSLGLRSSRDDEFKIKIPIIHNYRDKKLEIGNLTLFSNNDIVIEEVKLGFFMIVISAIIKTTALWVLFLLIFHIKLRKPLLELTKATTQIQLDKLDSFSLNIKTKGKNELKMLELALKSMTEKLITSRNSIIELNESLEEKVKLRTEELQKLNINLEKLANTDALTGLYNRRHFFTLVDSYLKMNDRANIDAVVLIMDIDKFKNINDTYGHDVGDEVLKGFSKVLVSNIRKGDICARFGGEEFLVFLPYTDIEQASLVAEKIRTSTQSYTAIKDIYFTISIGVSKYTKNIEESIKQADLALYKAKESGRNQVQISEQNS